MGEHLQPEPQYEAFDRPLESSVPKLDLANRHIDDIMAGEFVDASVTMQYRDEYPDDAPEVLAVNQLEWELNLLPGQNPTRAVEFATVLLSHGLSGDEYASRLGADMVVRLVGEEYELAAELIGEALTYERSARDVSRALADGIKRGIIHSADAAHLAGDFAWQLFEANAKVGKLEKEKRDLGRIAANAKHGSNMEGASGVLSGDGLTQINIFHKDKKKPRKSKK